MRKTFFTTLPPDFIHPAGPIAFAPVKHYIMRLTTKRSTDDETTAPASPDNLRFRDGRGTGRFAEPEPD
jgi:hypothetical protein